MNIYTHLNRAFLSVESGKKSIKKVLNENRKTLSSNDYRYFEYILKGTLENTILLEEILKFKSSIKLKKYREKDRVYMLIGIYAVLFSDNKDYAIVNEIVGCIKKEKYHLARIANAILRSVSREKNSIVDDIMKDRSSEEILSIKYSFPHETTKYLLKNFSYEEVKRIYVKSKESSITDVIAVNLSRDNLRESLEKDGYTVDNCDYSPNGLRLIQFGRRIDETSAYKEGLFYVQSQMSQIIGYLVRDRKKVLDVCSSPGGKSISLYSYNKDVVLRCCDISKGRMKELYSNFERLKIKASFCVENATKINKTYISKYDAVIIDAPCTGFGIIHRNPYSAMRKDIKSIDIINETQKKILNTASKYVKKGGVVLYSTCSILREENEEIVEDFLSKNENVKLLDIKIDSSIKSGNYFKSDYINTCEDGFFAAIMEKL